MNVGKLAIVLGSLVIIGLLIFFTISDVIPELFNYANCAFKAILNPAGDAGGLGACTSEFNLNF